MDIYGIGNALKAYACCYNQTSRRSGRTTYLLSQINDESVIVFAETAEASRIRKELCRLNSKASCIVIDPRKPYELRERLKGSPLANVHFDHTWVDMFYADAISNAEKFFLPFWVAKTEPRFFPTPQQPPSWK